MNLYGKLVAWLLSGAEEAKPQGPHTDDELGEVAYTAVEPGVVALSEAELEELRQYNAARTEKAVVDMLHRGMKMNAAKLQLLDAIGAWLVEIDGEELEVIRVVKPRAAVKYLFEVFYVDSNGVWHHGSVTLDVAIDEEAALVIARQAAEPLNDNAISQLCLAHLSTATIHAAVTDYAWRFGVTPPRF